MTGPRASLSPSSAALRLVAAAHLVLLLLFAASLFLATARARAETPACTGRDMVAAMRDSDPARLERIRAAASREPHGQGLLWRVGKPGVAPSYLFGTMHVTDPRVTSLPDAAREAFAAAGTIVIETLDVLDPAAVTALMLARPELMMFTDERTLTGLIPAPDRAMVEAAFDRRGVPLASLRKTKPWLVAALLALPQCELARKAAGAAVLDLALAEEAKAQGKRLEGLETMAGQLEAMASLPMEFHVDGLVETARLGDEMDDVMETMVLLYRDGETGMFWPFFRDVMPGGASGDDGYAEFQEAMIVSRNRMMAENARPLIDAGGAFIAVGALHLPGKDGLIQHLAQSGYAVTRAD